MTASAMTSWLVVISKQGSTIRAHGYNRCVTRRRPRDENHTVRFRQRQRIAVERGTRSWSGRLWRACKCWHPLDSGRKYGKKSSLWIYVSPAISQTNNCGLFSRIKWEIYFHKEVCFVRSLKYVHYRWLLPSLTPQCCSYWKGRLLVALDYGRQLFYKLYNT